MSQVGGGNRFLLEAFAKNPSRWQKLGQNLAGCVPRKRRSKGLLERGQAALPNLLDDAIWPQHVARLQCHGRNPSRLPGALQPGVN